MTADAHLSFDTRELARDIASFMDALHALSVEDCLMWGVSEKTGRKCCCPLSIACCPGSGPRPAIGRGVARWIRSGRIPDRCRSRRSLVREPSGDPETHRLAGVIDFETTSLGDPAWDLATQLHCGVGFAQLVFEAYGEEPGMWARAQQLFQLRQFEGLDWAIRQGDAAEFDESIAKLHLAGVLSRSAIHDN